jgi:3-keto-5-aminohexanoate cleavage enzyme
MSHLALVKPEMCSYDPGTMNWANSYVFLNEPKFLEELGTLTQELGVKPEIEIFDAGMIGNTNHYLKKGFLQEPLHCQFVLGVPGGMPGTVESLAYLLPKIPAGSTWSISGIGRDHMPCMLMGLAEGCNGLRVGLEDNIFFEKGVLATNPQLVARAVELGKLAGREIASASEAREILGLSKKV